MLIYRDPTEEFARAEIMHALQASLAALFAADLAAEVRERSVDALVRASELECALADAGAETRQAATLADIAASALVTLRAPNASTAQQAQRAVAACELPPRITVRVQEGFAFYALHPLQYAALAQKYFRSRPRDGRFAVVGIRSIGIALSAVVRAALVNAGALAERISVRPSGHPYERELAFKDDELLWVRRYAAAGAEFAVVDEGPGRSGSSFLAVAEALVRCGVARERITLLGSSKPEPTTLLAPDAGPRWSKFQAMFVEPAPFIPRDAGDDLSWGQWRVRLLAEQQGPAAAWPATWIETERLKFLSCEQTSVLKFEGYGRYGEAALRRVGKVAEAGFGPVVERATEGFLRYQRIGSKPAVTALSRQTLQRLAAYCAFRVQAFSASPEACADLAYMAGVNLEKLGFDRSPTLAAAGLPGPSLNLALLCPVITDSRMAPHEWLNGPSGELLKVDAAADGASHFYPGPADIAWDLAGAIVEWQMNESARAAFLNEYFRLSGDQARHRIVPYIVAYLSFRAGFTDMAAASCRDVQEHVGLRALCLRYRRMLSETLMQSTALVSRASQ